MDVYSDVAEVATIAQDSAHTPEGWSRKACDRLRLLVQCTQAAPDVRSLIALRSLGLEPLPGSPMAWLAPLNDNLSVTVTANVESHTASVTLALDTALTGDTR